MFKGNFCSHLRNTETFEGPGPAIIDALMQRPRILCCYLPVPFVLACSTEMRIISSWQLTINCQLLVLFSCEHLCGTGRGRHLTIYALSQAHLRIDCRTFISATLRNRLTTPLSKWHARQFALELAVPFVLWALILTNYSACFKIWDGCSCQNAFGRHYPALAYLLFSIHPEQVF